jgi:hypothetical protein
MEGVECSNDPGGLGSPGGLGGLGDPGGLRDPGGPGGLGVVILVSFLESNFGS